MCTASKNTSSTILSNSVYDECSAARDFSGGDDPFFYYVSQLCLRGSIDEVGSDTVFTTCASPNSSQFVSGICRQGDASASVLGSNTVFKSCSSPGPNQYVSQICNPGTCYSTGSDTVIASCSGIGCKAGSMNSLGYGGLNVAIIIAVGIGLIIACVVIFFVWRRRNNYNNVHRQLV